MKKIIESSRYLSIIGVVVLLLMAAIAFAWNAIEAGDFVLKVISGEKNEELFSLYLIKLVDGILISIFLLMLAYSVYSMFVGNLDLPDWMVAHNLDELKTKLGGVIVLVLAVRFLEFVLEGELASIDVMWMGIGIALMIVAFSVFIKKLGHPARLSPVKYLNWRIFE